MPRDEEPQPRPNPVTARVTPSPTDPRVAWRDSVLDHLVRVLAQSAGTRDLSRRLTHYLENARMIEAEHGARLDHPPMRPARLAHPTRREHLINWTAERLPELAHKRSDSGLRPFKVALLGLEGHFCAWREQAEHPRHAFVRARLRGAPAGPASPALMAARRKVLQRRRWHACVRLAERSLVHDAKVGRLPPPVHRLTPALRDKVIFTETGKIRAPKAAAMQLLYLACRYKPKHHGTTGQDFENFRTQLEHLKLTPLAL